MSMYASTHLGRGGEGMGQEAVYDEKPDGYYANTRSELYAFLLAHRRPPFPHVLNVGCANGADAPILRSLGARRLVGIEPVASAAAVADTVYDSVTATTFEQWSPEDGERYDLVVFADVLEHMVDPAAALRRTRTLLADGGAVLVSVPNVRCLSVLWQLAILGDWCYAPQGILDETHLRFFTAKSVSRLLGQCGYRAIALRHWGAWRLPALDWLDRAVPATGAFTRSQISVLARPTRLALAVGAPTNSTRDA